jgi:hypothetical protein
MSDGGTIIYCPKCVEFTECKRIDLANFGSETSYFGNYENEQRRPNRQYPDLSSFMRGRQCLEYNHEFISVEIHEDSLYELIQLRTKLHEIEQDFEPLTMGAPASEHLLKVASLLKKMETWLPELRR